jgi:hypothetical protein
MIGGDRGSEEGKRKRKNKIFSLTKFGMVEVPGVGADCYILEAHTN